MSARANVAFVVAAALAGCGRPATEPRLGAAATTPATPMPAAPKLLDDFEDVAPWRAVAADGVRAEVHGVPGARGQALRLDFDLSGTSGYAVARRALPLDLTGNFELTFELRGEAPVNNFELKLVDASGENVWWYHRRDQELSGPWRRVVVKKRQIEFAWGPTTDKTLRQIAAIEVVIAAGRGGGAGWIELDDLTLRALPSYAGPPPAPVAEASSALPAHAAARAVDGDPDTAWRTGRGAGAAELTLDLGRERDLAGLLVRWGAAWARRYQVETSLDGARWQLAAEVEGGDGGVDLLPLGEVTARHVRLRLRDGGGADGADGDGAFALAELELLDAEGAPTTNELLAALARRLPRGALPRAFRGEQAYWTVVGVDGGADSGLFSEDGALELRSGGPSVEPALTVGGETVTWADVRTTQALEDGDLPIPRVTWRGRGWELEITALAAGARDGAELAARYVLRNRGAAPLAAQLALAVRPLQVNPPTQFLNVAGGVAPLTELAWAADDGVLLLDGQPALRPLPAPDQVTLHPFHALDAPLHRPPPRGAGPQPSLALRDRARLGSAALRYDLRVAPGRSAEVVLTAPLLPGRGATTPPLPPAPLRAEVAGDPALAGVWFTRALTAMKERWRGLLDRVALRVPPAGAPIVETLRSSLAYMLISRDGPMLRPGTRSYARAWIRDGAMISEALLRLGHPAVAAAFLRWYAPYQYASGKVPCCVDAHGAGPVPEHDSQGQLMYLAHLVYRYGRDRALARAVWPSVLAAADYQEELRQSQRTAVNQAPGRRQLFGLLPPSISHEGYSARPAYSYWDDFWALRGLEDAAELAGELGEAAARRRLAAQRDELTDELRASLLASAAAFGVPFIPGAADLGDFDATSTTIAIAPGVSPRALPADLVAATFERYWDEHEDRREGKTRWSAYTPYELRTVGTFVRLGQRARAEQLLAFFFADRRPAGWNQWPEVVGKDPREPRFLGDLPHAWVHSDYARSALDLFAYELRDERALVLAAGVPTAWLEAGGVAVGGLPTPWGPLRFALTATPTELRLELDAAAAPPGGFVLPWPFPLERVAPGPVRALRGRAPRWRTAPAARGGGPELIFSERAARVVIARAPGRLP